MLDLIGLDVSDIKKAKEFFLAALKPLGKQTNTANPCYFSCE